MPGWRAHRTSIGITAPKIQHEIPPLSRHSANDSHPPEDPITPVISQPLDQRAGDGDRTFQSINGFLVTNFVPERRKQTGFGWDRFFTCIQQHKTARTIGIFRFARIKAGLAE
jgi:hypothetical protein